MGCAEQLKLLPHLVTLEAFVTHHTQPSRVSKWQNTVPFISLSCDDRQVHCMATSIRKSHDLGVAASAGFAHYMVVCATRRIGDTLMNHHMRAAHKPEKAECPPLWRGHG